MKGGGEPQRCEEQKEQEFGFFATLCEGGYTVANERKPEEERLVKTFREICDEAKGRIRETRPVS